MSLETFSKNLRYLRKKRGFNPSKMVNKVNAIIKKEFSVADDKMITVNRLNSYEGGIAYPPAYLLPILVAVLKCGRIPLISLFTRDLKGKDQEKNVPCKNN